MTDYSWKCLTDFSNDRLGLKEDKSYGKQWISSIIEKLESIEDDFEAINTMFAIQQKIGMAKVSNESYFGNEKYPKDLYEKLETTLRMLLKKRIQG